MDLNSMVFPRPNPSYKAEDYKNEMVWIPKKKDFLYNEIFKYSNSQKGLNSNTESTYFDKSQYLKTCNEILPTEADSVANFDLLGNQTKINKIPNIQFQIKNKFSENKLIKEDHIPCLFIKTDEANKKCDKLIIYFHANYEDLGNCYSLVTSICQFNRINVLAVEFPGYGVYDYGSRECSSDEILKDAEIIYDFLSTILRIKEENLIVMGRCIGSGPAVHLSYKYNPKCLILMSAFSSIKEAVKSLFKKYSLGFIMEKFVKNRFNNIELISKVKCPVLFIHGKQDSVIPWIHSYKMMMQCNSPAKLITPKLMDHNKYDIFKDIIHNIKEFFSIFLDESYEDNKFLERMSFRNSIKSRGSFIFNPDCVDFPKIMYEDPKNKKTN